MRILFLLISLTISIAVFAQLEVHSLNKGWQFRQAATIKWYKAEVPGTVHTDLLLNGLIPDPFYRDNENKVQWIEEKSWQYQTSFDVPTAIFKKKNIELQFKGLDTYAEVWLNGKRIIEADNMFREWKADVKALLKAEGNTLLINFAPAASIAKEKKQKISFVYPDNERVFVRKAQYQFGWDWGPRLVTCGIWKDVKLIGFDDYKIITARHKFKLEQDDSISIGSTYIFSSPINSTQTLIEYFINGNDTLLVHGRRVVLKSGTNTYQIESTLPNTLEERKIEIGTVYKTLSSLSTKNRSIAHEVTEGYDPVYFESQFSLSDVRLTNQKDSIGEAFYFKVNGKPTFIKGANWIPSDNFLPRAKKLKRYEQLIKAAKEANINMLRVWGGGVYEDDEFYDLCDKYGIMVWQDFMFAGALYPADPSFLQNIQEEVRYQVRRLRHHPSIVLWCGNNEIEEAWFNWGWQKQHNYSAQDSIKLWIDYKKIFHELIPRILKEEDPDRPYWPSSPSLGWGRDSAYKKGDVHYWGVWWGKEPVEKYNEKVGRFISEYGMQGIPDMKTIKQFSLPQDWDTSSAVMKTHQKHPFGWENIKYYIEQKFRTPKTFEDLVYVSQLMQADAIKTAIEAHRRAKPVTMGTLFWQWNDCWPVTSWSAVDYYGRKKALFYEVKRAFKDTVLLLHKKENRLQIKLDNDGDSSLYELSLSYYNGYSFTRHKVLQKGFRANKIYDFSLETNETDILVRANVIKNGSTIIASQDLVLHNPKNLYLQKTPVNFNIKGNELIVWADAFCYGVYIDVPDGVELEDNYFHLLANEPRTIKFTSSILIEQLKKRLKIKSLVDTY